MRSMQPGRCNFSRLGLLEQESATAAVESALIFGLATFILFAIIEFGLIMNAKIVITTAAREGARRASVDGGASEAARARVRDILVSAGLDVERLQVSINPHEAAYGSTITVRVDYAYRVATPLIAAISGPVLALDAQVICRSERVR